VPFRHKYTPIITTPEIKDVTDSEQWILETPLPKEGYGQTVPYDLGDAEIHHATPDRGLSACPVALWPKGGCDFVLLKARERGDVNKLR